MCILYEHSASGGQGLRCSRLIESAQLAVAQLLQDAAVGLHVALHACPALETEGNASALSRSLFCFLASLQCLHKARHTAMSIVPGRAFCGGRHGHKHVASTKVHCCVQASSIVPGTSLVCPESRVAASRRCFVWLDEDDAGKTDVCMQGPWQGSEVCRYSAPGPRLGGEDAVPHAAHGLGEHLELCAGHLRARAECLRPRHGPAGGSQVHKTKTFAVTHRVG